MTTAPDDLYRPASPEGTGDAEPVDETLTRPTTEARRLSEDDDEDYLEPPAPRSRLTTALLVALIFAIGLLAGVLLSRLSAAPEPQVVYVLNDASAAPATPATPR